MRIISKQNDYYDSIQAYGDDNSCIYKRTCESLNIQSSDFPFFKEFIPYKRLGCGIAKYKRVDGVRKRVNEWNVEPLFILFCGKVYPCLKCTHDKTSKIKFIYRFDDMHEIETFLSEHSKQALKHFQSYLKEDGNRWWYGSKAIPIIKRFQNFFDLFNKVNAEELFYEYSIPYFSLNVNDIEGDGWNKLHNHKIKITSNPSLKDYNFYSVKSSFEAYTDIRNFISQQLGGNSPKMVDISNEDMIVKKGFDKKISFRKGKTKNK